MYKYCNIKTRKEHFLCFTSWTELYAPTIKEVSWKSKEYQNDFKTV